MNGSKSFISMIVLACVMVSGTAFAQSKLSPELQDTAHSIIGGQISAFKARDHEKAFHYAAPGIRGVFGSSDKFIGMVKNGYGAIYGAQTWRYGRGQSKNDVLIQEVHLTGPQGRDWVALYTLRKQTDGSWRITAVQLKQGEAQNT